MPVASHDGKQFRSSLIAEFFGRRRGHGLNRRQEQRKWRANLVGDVRKKSGAGVILDLQFAIGVSQFLRAFRYEIFQVCIEAFGFPFHVMQTVRESQRKQRHVQRGAEQEP